MPSLVTVAANDIETKDFGVGNAAQQMMSQIGAVAGIQTMSSVSTTATTSVFAIAYTGRWHLGAGRLPRGHPDPAYAAPAASELVRGRVAAATP